MHTQPLVCPVCGLHNKPDAVFCANEACHKALGHFKYALEEVHAESTWVTKIADRINSVTGRPHFVTAHIIWFCAWIVLNSSVVAAAQIFDPYPYGLLGIILSIEATLITSFLLISNNRQNQHSEKRAELDYEVNVRTYRNLEKLLEEVAQLSTRIAELENKIK